MRICIYSYFSPLSLILELLDRFSYLQSCFVPFLVITLRLAWSYEFLDLWLTVRLGDLQYLYLTLVLDPYSFLA